MAAGSVRPADGHWREDTGMRLAVIPGDGIGPEVIDEALKVLDEVAPGVETTTYDLGCRALALAPGSCCRSRC